MTATQRVPALVVRRPRVSREMTANRETSNSQEVGGQTDAAGASVCPGGTWRASHTEKDKSSKLDCKTDFFHFIRKGSKLFLETQEQHTSATEKAR